jgi:hypothetical protein
MKLFIHLTTRVINKLHIIQIIKTPSKYNIHMTNHSFGGHIILGSGFISSNTIVIEICKHKNKPDFDTITHFIQNSQ